MAEALAWHNIWIALSAFVFAAMGYLNLQKYLKAPKPSWSKALFVALHLFTTIAIIGFALTDKTHPSSPPAAYVIAVVTFLAVSGLIGIWGLFDMRMRRTPSQLR
jgi:drug/metabolite transporter (DMT)-like permease